MFSPYIFAVIGGNKYVNKYFLRVKKAGYLVVEGKSFESEEKNFFGKNYVGNWWKLIYDTLHKES